MIVDSLGFYECNTCKRYIFYEVLFLLFVFFFGCIAKNFAKKEMINGAFEFNNHFMRYFISVSAPANI